MLNIVPKHSILNDCGSPGYGSIIPLLSNSYPWLNFCSLTQTKKGIINESETLIKTYEIQFGIKSSSSAINLGKNRLVESKNLLKIAVRKKNIDISFDIAQVKLFQQRLSCLESINKKLSSRLADFGREGGFGWLG